MTHHQDTNQQHRDHHGLSPAQRLRQQATGAREVRALRLDTTGALTAISYKGRPHHALRVPLGVRASDAPGGVGLEALDDDLTMWFDEYGAEHQTVNPAASVVAAAFGRGEQVYGPVVFTGWVETGGLLGGRTCDISAAATGRLAGIAASTDTPELPGGDARTGRVERSRMWSGLGIEITREIGRDGGPESFDALAWTITRDGDVPRCVECGEPGSHEGHQPEALAEQAGQENIQQEPDPGGAVSPASAGRRIHQVGTHRGTGRDTSRSLHHMRPDATIASVTGRGDGAVVVTAGRAGYRVTAGPVDDRSARITIDVDPVDLRRFVDDVLEHLRTRTGTRPSVPFEDSYPASARLRVGSAELNVYDDGDTFSVMARDGGNKAGTGAFATLTGVQDFARALDRHLTP